MIFQVILSSSFPRVKVLTWDKRCFVLLYKRLERGQFRLPLSVPRIPKRPGSTKLCEAPRVGDDWRSAPAS
jgi:hypothetical protein